MKIIKHIDKKLQDVVKVKRQRNREKTNTKQMPSSILDMEFMLFFFLYFNYLQTLEYMISANEMENKKEQVNEDNSLNATPFFFCSVLSIAYFVSYRHRVHVLLNMYWLFLSEQQKKKEFK